MSTYKRFEDLPCWQNARRFAAKANAVIENSKIKQSFKLRDQMLGSSGSVMDNIAEGFDRNSNAELVRFLFIAKGSAAEFKSQSYRALDAEWIAQASFQQRSKLAQDSGENL